MLTINTNTTSLTTQMNLSKSNSLVKTSIERMSTGFKINRASDDAANMSISKSMNCQISGTEVALENSQQAINLLQTADGALDNMQDNLQRIRELTVEALNGTYSSEEKQMIQQEVNQLLEETYKQKNNTYYNEIKIFGEDEEPPSTDAVNSTSSTTSTATAGTHEVTKLTEEEAIAQGYTCIHDASEFAQIKDNTSGKYCLMGDIDFTQVSGWGSVTLNGELNGNGYSINNYTSTSNGLFTKASGTIKNLNMNNVNVNTTNDQACALVGDLRSGTIDNCSVSGIINGGAWSGGLVGNNGGGTISNCSSAVTITGKTIATGGLAGNNDGTITNCSSSGNVSGDGSVGGLIGVSGQIGTITNCTSSATVTGATHSISAVEAGGLTGTNRGVMTNCSASGNVTGYARVGGLTGNMGISSIQGKIINCTASGTVTGYLNVGGLAGWMENGIIDKSYSTGDVTGTGSYTGGLVGEASSKSTISNSYSMGNVNGKNYVGGAVGNNEGTATNSYSTGTVTGSSYTGGFIGSGGTATNCYTTSDLAFSGGSASATNCHGTVASTGVTAHDASWFEDSNNLTFLGSAYDYSINPPDIIGNERPAEPEPEPEPTPTETGTVFQIGANSGEENTITVETAFSMGGYYADVTTVEAGQKTLVDTDNILNKISSERSKIGAMQNRLESVTLSLSTKGNNLEASHSTIVDTDYAAESSKLVKNQILQNVASSLLAQANTTPEIALQLLT